MRRHRFKFGGLLAFLFVLAGVGQTARAEHALLSPPQGTETLQNTIGRPALAALGNVLSKHDITSSMDEGLGIALIDCQTPVCIEETLAKAHADLGFILAAWKRRDDPSIVLTLTLLDRNNHSINVRQTIQNGNIDATATSLMEEVLRRRQQTAPLTPPPATPTAAAPKRKNAWLAGPIILLTGGAGTLTAGIVGAAKSTGCQQVSASGTCEETRGRKVGAVAAAISIGAAAIAGAAIWWRLGNKKREDAKDLSLGVGPGVVTARLDF